ncbi:MAG: SDR family oxidoreductase [Actinomycetota bacterium]
MDLGLDGRTAFVSGAYRGTGAGIAQALADEGAHVIVHGFEEGQPDDTVAAVRASGGSAEALVADLGSDAAVDAIAGVLTDVDVLVNNYGTPSRSSWSSTEHWHAEWDRNVLTGVRCTQPAIAGMRARGWGRVIFVGTVGNRMPGSRNVGYYAAKAGMPALVRTLAQELRGTGVTANLVSPGMIATAEVKEMVQRGAARDGVDGDWAEAEAWALANTMPNLTERIPDPVDIGRTIAFVASEAAWHITGSEIAIDGGAVDAR